MILWATLTATSATPALLLAPTGNGRTLGAGVIVLADQAGDSRSQAAALALLRNRRQRDRSGLELRQSQPSAAATGRTRPGLIGDRRERVSTYEHLTG